MAFKDSKQDYSVYFEDWLGGESVTLIETTAPNDVTSLIVTNVQSTMVTLSWVASTSLNVLSYDIYMGAAYLGTTTGTTYQATGLTPETTYTFTVKAKNESTSKGVSVTLTTPKTTYYLAMNGTSDYVITPVLTFDTVIMDISAEQIKGKYSAYLDASRGIAQSAFVRDGANLDFLQAAWQSVYIDEVDQTNLQGPTILVPTNQRITIRTVLKTAGKASLTIFANQIGQIPMKGILYSIRILLDGKLVALYDFTQLFPGKAVPDLSGNNLTATLYGGTWINR